MFTAINNNRRKSKVYFEKTLSITALCRFLNRVIDRYPAVKEYIWAQEEPRNMGAWSFMLERLELVKLNVRSRKYYAVPAAGSSTRFKKRHKAVIDSVFSK